MKIPDKSYLPEVMIIDDNPDNLNLLVKLLSDEGYNVRPANSGSLALAAIASKKPDLILLDINLPDINGYEVCRRLKADRSNCSVPVIFISALDEVKDKVRGFSIGGVDYISKPFQSEEVLARVRTHLELRNLQILLEKSNELLKDEIAERKVIEEVLFQEKERLKLTLFSVGDGVISLDKNENIEILNEAAQLLTGWSMEDAKGKTFSEVFNIINEYTREKAQNPISKVIESGRISGLANHTILISRDGTERTIADSAAPIIDMDGNIQGVVLVFRDITEEKQKQDIIEHLSYHDQLTGLYNRRFFEEEIKRLDTKRNLPLSLVMADVNGLKLANDAFGHSVGDKLLQKAAEIIKSACRTDDIVARWGGDEFIILLPKTSSEETEQIVNRIRLACINIKVDTIILSISLGWDSKFQEIENIRRIFKKAEDNMYNCKLLESPGVREETIQAIIHSLNEINKTEEQHSKNVGALCEATGLAMNFSKRDIDLLKTAGSLHDIGKIVIEEDILNKTGKLTDTEWDEIRRHPEVGYRILSSGNNDRSELAEYVLAHHERWDGKGYPKGLSKDKIPIISRIIAIADSYDNMVCERSYHKAYSDEKIFDEIKKNAGTQFDPELAKIFIEKILKKVWDKL